MTPDRPPNSRDASPDVLAQALWALYHSKSFADGFDRLLDVQATASVLTTYGALAGISDYQVVGFVKAFPLAGLDDLRRIGRYAATGIRG
jgi:hypothetical protein